ncbi:ferroxidase HEPHL1-like [Moschus berezovskii]|uniref:ferroxidase HEPHL1-like n=1 Tax=Moschus berezovskii TaxID=68408 RepID=UPI0024449AE3|nr:ferroxidase HEPHL1-like [Moschus berezovskii]
METTYTVLRNIDNRIPYSTKSPSGGASRSASSYEPVEEQLYFFGQSLDPKGARAALVILFVLGLLLLVLSVVLSVKLCSARPRAAYQEVQSCALPTDAL